MQAEVIVLGCAGLVCPVCLASCGHPMVGVDTSENRTVSTAGVCAGYAPKSPPVDSERRARKDTCNHGRFLEAMVLNDSAKESFRANRTLCEPRPSA
jgi:hypothetical protein